MLRSHYQTVHFFQYHNVPLLPAFIERMAAFATSIAKGAERFWTVPANTRHDISESPLLPAWYK